MRRFLDPRSDIVFKRIFGEHPEILREFLNNILPFDKETDNYYHDYRLVETDRPHRVLHGLRLVFAELPKFSPCGGERSQFLSGQIVSGTHFRFRSE